MRPWWEPEPPQQPDQHPLSESSQSAASPIPESRNGKVSRLLLPLPLLAPFTENSTASGNFPAGYYCTVCGRVNVQRFLRHRVCEGTACDSRTDPQREIGWVISVFSTCDRKLNSATVVPDDKWTAPTTAEPAAVFDNGARLFHYHLVVYDSGPSVAPSNLLPSGGAGTVDVRHVFNGNRELLLQGDASALFETLQRDVRIERSIGSSAFVTPRIESGDDPALGRNGQSVWDQQAAFIESALGTYCRDLGPLKVRALRVHAWISVGKHIQTFSPGTKHLVLLCLGADIALLSLPSDPNVKSNGKPRKECLRVTMVHGDIVVLSGSQFKFSTIRTGMCMLLEAECN
ncbi:hypothetical protein EDB86DRAFT_924465 [Lactarius hatsudake]|nr:hypothetical protein EDB86DRAFT_924465 [Lactarius hatsudake]